MTAGNAETARALNSGALHLLRSMRAIDRRAGLTSARLSALSVLVFGGPCTLGELAHAEDVAGPTMTRLVDGLAAAGLARRRPHPDDGRAVQIAPTARGTALMHKAAGRRIDAIAAAIGELPTDQRRALAAAAPLLDALAGSIRTATPPVTPRRSGR